MSRHSCDRASGTSSRKRIPKIAVISPTAETKSFKKGRSGVANSTACVPDVAEHPMLGGKHFLLLGQRSRKDLVAEKGATFPEKSTIANGPLLRGEKPK